MLRLAGRRVATAIPLMIVVSFFIFMLIDLAPGDPAVRLAGDNPTPQLVEQIRQALKLDRPPSLRDSANLALFLASDESAYMSGVCVPATDGGTHARVALSLGEGDVDL